MVLRNNLFKARIGSGMPEHAVTSSKVWVEVKDVMSKNVVVVSPREVLSSAAKKMADRNISCVVVKDKNVIVGILTERDLVHTVSKVKEHSGIRIESVMSFPVYSVDSCLSVLEASKILDKKHIRRLPVINKGKLEGIVTQTDLTRVLTSYGIWTTLRAIMTKKVVTIEKDAFVIDATKKMSSRNISCIVVLDNGKLAGIVSERDIIKRVVAVKKNPHTTRMKEIMTTPAIYVHPDYSVFSASRLMERLNIRRLIIVGLGELCGIVTQTDIFRAVKSKLHNEEEENMKLLEKSEYCVYTSDSEGNIVYINPALMKLVEADDKKVFLNKPFLPLQFWQNSKDYERFTGKQGKEIIEKELCLKTSKGKKRYVVISTSFIKDIHGNVNGMQGLIRDVTAEKDVVSLMKAKGEIEKSEERYRLITENASDLIAVVTFERTPKYVYMSPSHKRILGYDPKKYTGKTGFDITHPDDKKKIIPLIKKYLALKAKKIITGKSEFAYESIEFRVKDIKGNWHNLECRASIMKDELLLVSRDVTERKKAEDAVRQSEKRYRLLFESATDGIIIAEIKTRKFMYVNPAICRMLGYTEKELKQMNVSDIHPKDKLKHIISEFEAQARGKNSLAQNIPCLKKDRTIIYADINTTLAILDETKCNVGFFRDVTYRKKYEDEREDHTVQLQKRTSELELANTRLKQVQDKLNHQVTILGRFKDSTVDQILKMKEIEEENRNIKRELRRLKKHEE
ncbi:MAG: CBS domain-containing protein [Candidatus Aenigmarchaeota archaeon]|nr:CBS domain-containing protein [Candidatus Aenigmarchaeota archaeon]